MVTLPNKNSLTLPACVGWPSQAQTAESAMKILHLNEKIPWFGGHSGYEQLTRHLQCIQPVQTVKPRTGQLARYVGSIYARLHGRDGRGAASLSECEFRLTRILQRPRVSHILYSEHHFELFSDYAKLHKDLIGTVHLPPSVWKPEQSKTLACLSAALVLYQKDISCFEKVVGKGRVRFIHHGADTDFFKPDATKRQSSPRLLYSGVYLRNEPMLVRLVQRIYARWPEIKFDLLVPTHHRWSPNLEPLTRHPAVVWHAGLNDEELRNLYQKSYLMLLPMNDSGANTAVVEALTSGLPIITTDVGGICDYGGNSIFPIVSNNDDEAMMDLLDRYLTMPNWRDEVGQRCREFAEENMAWPVVAQKHLNAYRELCA